MSYTHQNLAARAESVTAVKIDGWVLDDFGGKFAPSGHYDNSPTGDLMGPSVEIYCSDEGFRIALDDDHWRADIPWEVLKVFCKMCDQWLMVDRHSTQKE